MYDYRDLRVAIVGGGIAGAYTACMLSKDRYNVTLFKKPYVDSPHQLPLVLPPQIYRQFLLFSVFQKKYNAKYIHRLRLASLKGKEVSIKLPSPLLLLQKKNIEDFLLQKAMESGGIILENPVSGIDDTDGFILEAGDQTYKADFLVGADGQDSYIRQKFLGSSFDIDFQFVTYAYLPQVEETEAFVQFLPNLSAYFWILPSSEGTFVGIRDLSRKNRSELLEKLLYKYTCSYYGKRKIKEFFPQNAKIPISKHDSFEFQRYMGPNWAFIGSSTEMVDPITGFTGGVAMESAYAFCDAFSKIRPTQYPGILNSRLYTPMKSAQEFLPFLSKARSVNFMVSALRKSPQFRKFFKELLTGGISYERALQNKYKRFFSILKEVTFYNLGYSKNVK